MSVSERAHQALEDNCAYIVNAFGSRAQMVKAVEECGELITQLAKRLNNSPTTDTQIIDEIADVMVTVAQLRFMFGREMVDERVLFKTSRTLEFIRLRALGVKHGVESNE